MGTRYFDMTAYWQWRAAQAGSAALEGGQSQAV
jgi:hypothetical protein